MGAGFGDQIGQQRGDDSGHGQKAQVRPLDMPKMQFWLGMVRYPPLTIR
jgi:hypothetical protein